MKKLIATLAVAAGLAFGATACTAPPEVVETPTPTVVEESAPPAGDAAEVEPEPTVPEVVTAQFGKTGYAFEDGLTVTISKPEEFTPSEWAAAEVAEHYLKYEVTLTNNTGAAYDPSMFYTTLSSAGAEMTEVFDTDTGLDGAPMTPVLPGKSVTFPVGYPVDDPADVTMSVTVDYDRENVLFTN